tara:strand:- start:43 stop:294 length:252 start_codon:yes stop_codon:yes gene_type:complete
MSNKVLYFKSVFRNFKPDDKVSKLISEAIKEGNDRFVVSKTKRPRMDSKKFILKHTEDFLGYAVDYSLKEKFSDVLGVFDTIE